MNKMLTVNRILELLCLQKLSAVSLPNFINAVILMDIGHECNYTSHDYFASTKAESLEGHGMFSGGRELRPKCD